MAVIEFGDTMILAPTFSKYERYIDALVALLEKNWDGHPELYFFSDNSSTHPVCYKKLIRSERPEWPYVVYNGAVKIKARYPSIQKILLLNEEAFPLTTVDQGKLRRILDTCMANDLNYVYFPCYAHSWEFKEKLGNENLCITPADYTYYTQLGPAFWDIDHLIDTCSHAISHNILSPWMFERIVTSQIHYISDYRWPTVADGLFVDGFVNVKALRQLTTHSALKSLLVRDYIVTRPVKIYRWIWRKTVGAINRVLQPMKLKPLVYPYRS